MLLLTVNRSAGTAPLEDLVDYQLCDQRRGNP